ncbi:MAG: hypothetical protein ACYTG0_11940 [Planctomycetota bacterium]|jgi:hypothetical protein
MTPHASPTGYARLTPFQARVVLAGLLVVTIVCVGITVSPLGTSRVGTGNGRDGDVDLYRAKLDRIRAGSGYYEAAAAELTSRGYPTRSVFNWRTPLPIWALGKLPHPLWGKCLLGFLALAVVFFAFEALAREQGHGLGRPAACALLLTGPLMPCVLGDLFVMPMLWAGVFIALSVCAYGMSRSNWGVAFGLLAVFCRELALPYCVLAAALAWWNRRRGELAAWLIGLLAWGVFFGCHWLQVASHVTPDARAHGGHWIELGGAAFVISTAQMTAYLLLLPQWVTALYFMAAMFGFAGWHTPFGQRVGLTACLFVMAFAVVGYNFNQYWGSLIAPLFCFGVVRFPASVRDLWHAAAPAALGSPHSSRIG